MFLERDRDRQTQMREENSRERPIHGTVRELGGACRRVYIWSKTK